MVTVRFTARHLFVLILLFAAAALFVMAGDVQAQGPQGGGRRAPAAVAGTGFTYQGQLKNNGAIVNATCDFRFGLWDLQSGGAQVGVTQSLTSTVANGLFTVELNASGQITTGTAFNGDARWLASAVACPSGGAITALNPRQKLTPAPMAFALPGLYTQQNATSPNILGGSTLNSVLLNVVGATISGGGATGGSNRVFDDYGTVGGGYDNWAGDNAGPTFDRTWATVGGGTGNRANAASSTIAGGNHNTASNTAATVGGGANNTASGFQSTVGGGDFNNALGNYAHIGGGTNNGAAASNAAVSGGDSNVAGGNSSTIGGGYSNDAGGAYATIAGGYDNNALGSRDSVGGGENNYAIGQFSTIPGGRDNVASDYSFAAGRRAEANNQGSFVWADCNPCAGSGTIFASTADNQFLVRANGGMGVGTSAPTNQLHVVEAMDAAASPENHVVLVENNHSNTTGSQDVLALRITNVITPGAANNYITFFGANASTLGSIEGNGTGSVVLSGAGADYAEWLPRRNLNESITPGDIVGIVDGRVTKATRGASHLMVVSDRALVAGNDPGKSQRHASALVAFVGQVPVQVRGAVHTGDFIIPSGNDDGIGIAVSPETITGEQFADVVGQAWESSTDSGVKRMQVAIGLTHSDPTIQRLVKVNQSIQARLAVLEQAANLNNESARADALPNWLMMGGVVVLGLFACERQRGVK